MPTINGLTALLTANLGDTVELPCWSPADSGTETRKLTVAQLKTLFAPKQTAGSETATIGGTTISRLVVATSVSCAVTLVSGVDQIQKTVTGLLAGDHVICTMRSTTGSDYTDPTLVGWAVDTDGQIELVFKGGASTTATIEVDILAFRVS